MVRFDFCKECDWCCKKGNPVPLSDRELALMAGYGLPSIKVDGLNYVGEPKGRDCFFLGEIGCTLDFKPVVCGIFPFQPTKRGWVLRTECPRWYMADGADLEAVKMWFEGRKEDYRDK